jgi:hypothetical protein
MRRFANMYVEVWMFHIEYDVIFVLIFFDCSKLRKQISCWSKTTTLTMVFCYQNCSDLLWEKIVLVIEKNFWNSRLKAKNLQICRTIYSNNERSEEVLVTERFYNLFLEVSHILYIRTIRIQIGKNYLDLETCRKSLKIFFFGSFDGV